MYEIEPDICLEILGGDLLSRFLSQPSEKSNSLANFLMSTLDRQFIQHQQIIPNSFVEEREDGEVPRDFKKHYSIQKHYLEIGSISGEQTVQHADQ